MKAKKVYPKRTLKQISEDNPNSTVSVLSGPEKRLMALINGDKPRNEREARMQKQANEMLKNGMQVDIPSM